MKQIILSILMTMAIIGFGVLNNSVAFATLSEVCSGSDSEICKNQNTDLEATAKKVAEILFLVIGAMSVIMIVYGGLKYVLSAGDARQVEAAKQTIIYAVVGLIVAILAGSIVTFVIGKF